jgi:hypothetical protein
MNASKMNILYCNNILENLLNEIWKTGMFSVMHINKNGGYIQSIKFGLLQFEQIKPNMIKISLPLDIEFQNYHTMKQLLLSDFKCTMCI